MSIDICAGSVLCSLGLGQRSRVERALVVEIFLDAGDALGVEVDIAHDMRRRGGPADRRGGAR